MIPQHREKPLRKVKIKRIAKFRLAIQSALKSPEKEKGKAEVDVSVSRKITSALKGSLRAKRTPLSQL